MHDAAAPGPQPRVGVGIMVVDDSNRVLLTLRRRPPEVGAWSILGGRVEPFERLLDCAIREAREEAGVTVEIERLLCVTDHIVIEEHEHWVARVQQGEPVNMEPDKTLELRWFPLSELPERLTITAHAAIEAFISVTMRSDSEAALSNMGLPREDAAATASNRPDLGN
jgi:8-oxo-dGTP diphosphatase